MPELKLNHVSKSGFSRKQLIEHSWDNSLKFSNVILDNNKSLNLKNCREVSNIRRTLVDN